MALRRVIEVCSERIQQLESYITSFDKEVPLPLSAEVATLLRELQATITGKHDVSNESDRNSPDQSPLLPTNNPDLACQDEQHEQLQEHNIVHDHVHVSDFASVSKGQDDVHFEHPETHAPLGDIPVPMPDFDDFMDFQGLVNHDYDWSWTVPEEQTSSQVTSTVPVLASFQDGNNNIHASESGPLTDPYDSFDDESDGEILEQLSIRLGGLKIVDDGTLRFFGPTSNMTLSPAGTLYNFGHLQKVDSSQNHIRIENLVSSAQFDHFVNLFFCWQNSFLPLIDREVFSDDLHTLRDGQDVLFCSEPLKLSM